MHRIPRLGVRFIHATAKSSIRAAKKPIPDILPAERLDLLRKTLEENAHADSKYAEQFSVFEMLEVDRPKRDKLRQKAYDKLVEKLKTSYTVAQLQTYLKSQNIPTARTKNELVDRVIQRSWGLQSPQQRAAESKVLSKAIQSSKRELVLLISDQGQFLRNIQQETNVSITVQSEEETLLLQGTESNIEKATEMLESSPKPIESVRKETFQTDKWLELERLIPQVSKLTQAFVSVEQDGVLCVYGKDKASVDSANRLLDVLIAKLKLSKTAISPDAAAHTFVSQLNTDEAKKLAFLPFYDPISMPLFAQASGWSRLRSNQANEALPEMSTLIPIHNKGLGTASSLDNVRDIFARDFFDERSSRIEVQTKFGHILFQNPASNDHSIDYLHSPIENTFTIEEFSKQYNWKDGKRVFYSSRPPANLTTALTPLTLRPKRSVSLNFIASDAFKSSKPNHIERLRLAFDIDNGNQLILNDADRETQRTVVDIASLVCPDVRIRGRVYQPLIENGQPTELQGEYQSAVESIRDQCRLTHSTRLSCPTFANMGPTPLTLLSVMFNNMRQYRINDHTVLTVNDAVDQDGNTTSQQLTSPSFSLIQLNVVNPANNTTNDNPLIHWNSFIEATRYILARWR
ncbi:hypothetical protein INT43_007581 [Umbelopsis isabellina]|uniref:SAP domain-containing protein n=1 Tax=Mortierella isabellina TaxID=91625 RepID=A0A8H7PMT8_MORIS|nr:hypothetical protein INT43_007581 [Umbelopsis isabellina]